MIGLRRTSSIPALAVLQNSNFRIIWGSKVIHEVARRMELLVLILLLREITGSYFQLGLLAVFLNAPRPVLSLFSGVIADRLDRRRILIAAHACYLGIAAVILVLLIANVIEPWHVFGVVFLQGLAKVLDDPSRRTAMFDVVGAERIANAVALEQGTSNIGKIMGPLAGGILIAATGFAGAYALLTVLDLAALLLMVRLRLPHQAQGTRLQMAVWDSLREGIGYALNNRTVLGVLLISLVMNGMVLRVQEFIPVIATDHLLVGPFLAGLLTSAEGIGSLIGAGIIALTSNIRYHGRLFVAGSLIMASLVLAVSWSPWFFVSFTLLFLAGIAQSGFSTMQSTILLLSSPAGIRGRIVGVNSLTNGTGQVAGPLEIGWIADAVSITFAIGLNAGVAMLLILPVVILTPLVWRPLDTVLEQPTHPEPASAPSVTSNPSGEE
ncbi:MAG: MFS transporter [Dehalococcoidia bacterium]